MGAHHSDRAAGHMARSCDIFSEWRVMQIAHCAMMSPQISKASCAAIAQRRIAP
jgi:hypothetical protein